MEQMGTFAIDLDSMSVGKIGYASEIENGISGWVSRDSTDVACYREPSSLRVLGNEGPRVLEAEIRRCVVLLDYILQK
jgi:hypothetical protein